MSVEFQIIRSIKKIYKPFILFLWFVLGCFIFFNLQNLLIWVPHLIHLSGWFLFILMIFLACYNFRKKIEFIAFIPSRVWLNVHIYIGMIAVVIFCIHTRYSLPRGVFEWGLFIVYLSVTVTGIYGWVLSRVVPKVMTAIGGEVLYEMIPMIRNKLQEEAHELMLSSVKEGNSTVISTFYREQLFHFLYRKRVRLLDIFFQEKSRSKYLLYCFSDLERYMNKEEKRIAENLKEVIVHKCILDKQQFFQRVLRYWFFVHIPLTYSLLLFMILHLVLVLAFSGGVR